MSGDWLRKVCSVEGCTNLVKNNGVCIRHGADVKQCKVDGCPNGVVKDGVFVMVVISVSSAKWWGAQVRRRDLVCAFVMVLM